MLQSRDVDTGAAPPAIAFSEFVAIIAVMMALTALAIDIMLPALGDIGRDLGLAEDNHRQLVITFYLVGFAVGQIVFGPISDRFGRKTPLYGGLVLLALASIVAATAQTAFIMFAARVLQGFGAAAARIIAVAVVRDRFAGREMARVMSFVMMIFIVIPIFAPLMGQGVMQLGNWRWIFGALVVSSLLTSVWVWLRMPESHPAEKRMPLSAERFAQAVRTVVTSRVTVGYSAAFSFFFGVLMSYVGSVEQIFVDVYGLGDRFPLVFGAIAFFMIPSFFLNSRLVRQAGMRRVSHIALIGFVGVCGLMALAGYPEKPPLIVFSLFIVATFFCFGLIGPNFNAMAMEPMGAIAGTASSFVGFFTTTAGALFGFLVGQSFDGTVRPLTIGFTVLGLAALVCVLVIERGKLAQPQQGVPPRP
jgi:DHA1 family bicyclomycin/chloramphenicol resistance-like MFS transporter